MRKFTGIDPREEGVMSAAPAAKYVDEHDLGQVLTNDSGVITERGHDTVRGADVVYYSYARLPKGSLLDHYLEIAPDLIVEDLSPSDRWPKVLAKVAEYLDAGTSAVMVPDEERRMAYLYRPDGAPRSLTVAEELTIPDVLGDLAL
jgi:Uma2 family endonuclease